MNAASRSHGLALLLIVCIFSLTVHGASAQVLPAPDLSRQALLDDLNVELLTTELGLSQDQYSEILIAVDGFVQWHRRILKEVVEKDDDIAKRLLESQDKMQDPNGVPPEVFAQMNRVQEESRAQRRHAVDLSDEVLRQQEAAIASVNSQLTSDQQRQFEATLRTIRRRRTIDWEAKFPAERVDLVYLFLETGDLSAAEKESLRPALQRYVEELDAALRLRNAKTHKEPVAAEADFSPTQVEQALNAGRLSREEFVARLDESNAERAERHIERWRPIMAAHRRVADVNRSYFDLCLSQLSPASQTKALHTFWGLAYATDRIEMPRAVDQFITDLLDLESLTPAQRDSIEGIRDNDWWPARRSIETSMRRIKDEMSDRWEDGARNVPQFDALRSQRSDLFNQRTELERRIIKRIATTLTDDQRQQVKVPTW